MTDVHMMQLQSQEVSAEYCQAGRQLSRLFKRVLLQILHKRQTQAQRSL